MKTTVSVKRLHDSRNAPRVVFPRGCAVLPSLVDEFMATTTGARFLYSLSWSGLMEQSARTGALDQLFSPRARL